MNIAIVCYPTFGGSGVVATELARGLALRNHNVHVISYDQPARLDTLVSNIFYHEVNISAYPLFQYPPYALALANQLVDLIKFQNIDVIHVHYAIPHATSAWLAKQIVGKAAAHIPIITTLHGTDITIVGKDSSYKNVVEFSINNSDGVTAVSKYLKEETMSVFDITTDIEVVYNFIDLERFQKSDKNHFKKAICSEDEKIMVHISNFRKVKRVPEVVKVFKKVLEKGIKAKLLMVGDGPDRTETEKVARNLGICQHVRFLGKQEKIEEVLSVSDLFVMPSGSETFGLAALEAMSCGVPVISSNVGGLPELNVHGKTGFLCELDDINAMSEYAIQLLSNDEMHAEFSKNARARAEEFNIDKIILDYENHYLAKIERLK